MNKCDLSTTGMILTKEEVKVTRTVLSFHYKVDGLNWHEFKRVYENKTNEEALLLAFKSVTKSFKLTSEESNNMFKVFLKFNMVKDIIKPSTEINPVTDVKTRIKDMLMHQLKLRRSMNDNSLANLVEDSHLGKKISEREVSEIIHEIRNTTQYKYMNIPEQVEIPESIKEHYKKQGISV